MIETIFGQGGDLLSSVEAGRLFGYTNDYVARLARKGKVRAVRIGREWLVDRESLGQFVIEAETAKREHAARIREERKRQFRAAKQSRWRLIVQRAFPWRRGFVLIKGIVVVATGVLLGSSLFTTASLLEAPWAVDPQKQDHSAPSISKGYSGLARTITYTADETAAASITARFRFHLPSLSLPVFPEINVRAAVGTVFLELSDGLRFAMRELWCDAASLFKDDACVDASMPAAPEPIFDEPPAPAPAPAPISVSTPIATPAPTPTPTYTTVAGDTHITNITNPTTFIREYHEIEVEREPRVRRVLFDGQVDQIYNDMQAGFSDLSEGLDEEFGSIGVSFETALLTVTGNTDLGGTLSVAGAGTFETTLQVLGATTLNTLTATDSATTNATSTTFYATTARGTDLVFTNADFGSLVADAATSTDLFATRAVFGSAASTNLVATNATTTNFYTSVFNTDTASIADLTVSEFVATSATSTNLFAANLVATAATTTDFFTTRLAVDSFSLSSGITSHFVPSANDTYDLGSASFYWRNGYIDTITVNSISAASTSIGGTNSESLTINADNATTDTEDMSLIFYRGSVVPNAVLAWNSTADRFEFNQPAYISNQSGSTTASTLTLQGVPGQTGDIFRIASSTGNTIFAVAYDGAVTISTSTITALTSGTTTLTNLEVTNTSTSTFAGGINAGALAVAGAATFDGAVTTSGLFTFASGFISHASSTVAGDFNTTGTLQAAGIISSATSTAAYFAASTVGTAGAPAFTFSSDLNTGLWSPGADTLALSTGGTERLTVTSAGNVGIGTTTPADIVTIERNTSASNALTLINTSGGTAAATGMRMFNDTSSGLASLRVFGTGYTGVSSWQDSLVFNTAAGLSGGIKLQSTTGGITLSTTGLEGNDFVVGSTGNVGIGTTSPAAKLGVAGNAYIGGNLTATGTLAISGASTFASHFTLSGSAANIVLGSNWLSGDGDDEGITVNASGEVGIGVAPESGKQLAVTGDSRFNGSVFINGNGSHPALWMDQYAGPTTIKLDTDGDSYLTGGNVGIGATSPRGLLDVQTTSQASGVTAGYLYSAAAATGVSTTTLQIEKGAGYGGRISGYISQGIGSGLILSTLSGGATNDVMTLTNTGNVGIGVTGPQSMLHVRGSNGVPSTSGNMNTGVIFASGSGAPALNLGGYNSGAQATSYGFLSAAYENNAGVYLPLALQPNGGNVGIGTAAPANTLHVVGANLPLATTDTANLVVGTSNASGDNLGGSIGFGHNGPTGTLLATIKAGRETGGTNTGYLAFATRNDSVFSTERMRISSAGNVGIGTVSPVSKLHVDGDITLDASGQKLYFAKNGANPDTNWSVGLVGSPTGAVFNTNSSIVQTVFGGGTGYGYMVRNTSNVSLFEIQGIDGKAYFSGNVGIGTTPLTQSKLTVGGSLSVNGSDTDFGAGGNRAIIDIAGGYARIGAVNGGGSAMGTKLMVGAGTEAVTILSGGNVGIGDTNPSEAKLSVTGSIAASTDIVTNSSLQVNPTGYLLYLRNVGGDNRIDSYNFPITQTVPLYINASTTRFAIADVDAMTITSDRNVGIGTSNPSAQLHTTGTVRFANFGAGTLQTDANGNLSVSSDERLKNLEGEFTKGLAEVLALEPINFTWKKETGFDTANVYTGFSAQNVQPAIPEAIGEDKHGFLTLSERPILAAVVNAVKELYEGMTSLQTTVADFATEFYSNRLRTDELCVGATCVTEVELQALLEDRDVDVPTNDEDPAANGDAPVSSSDTPTPDSSDQAPSDIGAMDGGVEEPEVDASTTEIEPGTEGPGDVDQDTPPEAPPEETPPADPDPAPETAGGE